MLSWLTRLISPLVTCSQPQRICASLHSFFVFLVSFIFPSLDFARFFNYCRSCGLLRLFISHKILVFLYYFFHHNWSCFVSFFWSGYEIVKLIFFFCKIHLFMVNLFFHEICNWKSFFSLYSVLETCSSIFTQFKSRWYKSYKSRLFTHKQNKLDLRFAVEFFPGCFVELTF